MTTRREFIKTAAVLPLIQLHPITNKIHSPFLPNPESPTLPEYLRDLCLAGLKGRYADEPTLYGDGKLQPAVIAWLDRELEVIDTLGFTTHLLVTADCVRFAIRSKILYSARGSLVGSLTAYALKLSHVCPLKYDLLFERFPDVGRKERPVIGIDFCKDRRIEVVHFMKQKYGAEEASQICSRGTWSARAAIRNAGREIGTPIPQVDAVVRMIPEALGIRLVDALKQSPELKRTYENDPEVRKLLDLAQKVEGTPCNVVVNGLLVVVDGSQWVKRAPPRRPLGNDDAFTQHTVGDIARAGSLKLKFFGLQNLTLLARIIDLIEQSTGTRIDPYQLPRDDAKTFALLSRGRTKGISQLESAGIRDVLRRMKPDRFHDLVAVNALYRPGPLEAGMLDEYLQGKLDRKRTEYVHPVLKGVLEETHGVMAYQEQAMRILNRLGGIELADAYTCIKAINKKSEMIAAYRTEFVDGAKRNGLTDAASSKLFQMIEKCVAYTFNKSHSTAYSLITYATAYLKANYPAEFMAAYLKPGDRGWLDRDGFHSHLAECKGLGIDVTAEDDDGFSFRLRNGEVVRI